MNQPKYSVPQAGYIKLRGEMLGDAKMSDTGHEPEIGCGGAFGTRVHRTIETVQIWWWHRRTGYSVDERTVLESDYRRDERLVAASEVNRQFVFCKKWTFMACSIHRAVHIAMTSDFEIRMLAYKAWTKPRVCTFGTEVVCPQAPVVCSIEHIRAIAEEREHHREMSGGHLRVGPTGVALSSRVYGSVMTKISYYVYGVNVLNYSTKVGFVHRGSETATDQHMRR